MLLVRNLNMASAQDARREPRMTHPLPAALHPRYPHLRAILPPPLPPARELTRLLASISSRGQAQGAKQGSLNANECRL